MEVSVWSHSLAEVVKVQRVQPCTSLHSLGIANKQGAVAEYSHAMIVKEPRGSCSLQQVAKPEMLSGRLDDLDSQPRLHTAPAVSATCQPPKTKWQRCQEAQALSSSVQLAVIFGSCWLTGAYVFEASCITGFSPANNADDFALDGRIVINFSEAIAIASMALRLSLWCCISAGH